MFVGVDASRNRSGGAKAHLIGILSEGNPLRYGIREVHVWAYKSLLDSLPERTWLIKHNPPELEQSILKQLWWQRFRFPIELKQNNCSIVLNTDAGTISTQRPSVTMSRDMLSYEPGEIQRFAFGKAKLRLTLLRFIQNRSLRDCDGAIFLTRYAADVIQKSCGKLDRIAYIPHGVGSNFKIAIPNRSWGKPIRSLYVSNAAMYKHQWVVVRAIKELRDRGHDIVLTLIGGGSGKAQNLLNESISLFDPSREFVLQQDFIPQEELPGYLMKSDLFIFASSCENMPNTLLEAMATGLPIACSNRGPMPEVLSDGGIYFDPEDYLSITDSVEQIVIDPEKRSLIAHRAKILSDQYSWKRCADETWKYIVDIYKSLN